MDSWRIDTVKSQADWAALGALLRVYADHDLDHPHLSTIWNDLDDLPARYGRPEGLALLIRSNPLAPAIACGAFARTQVPGLCEIKRIYVTPAQRHRGHAKRMIQALLGHAAQAGYTQAALSTWRSNTPSLALYAQLGFAPVPSFKKHPNPDLLYLGLALPRP